MAPTPRPASADSPPRTTAPGPRPSSRSPGSTSLPSAEELAAFGRAEAARALAEARASGQSELEAALGRAGIPERFAGLGFEDYRAETPEQRRALAICRGYAERFARVRERGACLVLAGGPGTGKTHLACAILARAIAAGHTGLFVTISEALRTIRDSYSPHAARSETQAFALFTEPDLLVLDEVGVAIGDDAKRRALLFDVLNTRYARRRPTVLIGNLTADELGEYLGERILDRVLETGSALVAFNWPSHRRRTAPGPDAPTEPRQEPGRG